MDEIPVIICGGHLGKAVVFGWTKNLPEIGKAAELRKARMVLSWPTAAGGLFGLASKGPVDGTRITCTVATVRDVPCQVLSVTAEAAKIFVEWKNA